MSFDVDNLKYNSDGLIPAIIQDVNTKDVLMMAYMNKLAVEKTIESGETWFWSRSRQTLWHKGETSGNNQIVRDIFFDCDADTLLVQAEQKNAACHKGYFSCFHNKIQEDGTVIIKGEKLFDPGEVYGKKK
ncbi:MAG: phosphoribosyl-AMP cyclohydrolase [Clostridiales bacterium]|nr:phosphoribosyl-AMP cyclohydrolase [Clostridiales bacterium]MCF8021674.1 phosphoribosyl-AMP cyclohydrolase [Clostridiales bacterium]